MINIQNIIKFYQVDAFTDKAFKGNPAAVCYLENNLDDDLMIKIASEMNLSETAFVRHISRNIFSLRWFTPRIEVPLCGHATVAASKVLFEDFNISGNEIIYDTKSGALPVKKNEDGFILDFPIDKPLECNCSNELLQAMGISKYVDIFVGQITKKLVIQIDSLEELLKLSPDFLRMLHVKDDIKGVAVTVKGNGDYDFITRYFNPWAGVNEDPVTGSVHTVLANYWANKLNKNLLKAYQASQRGGELILDIRKNSRVDIIGKAVIVMRGEIFFDSQV